MPSSMTGFGTADGPVAGGRLHLEIKTVNHRHFNVQLKVPNVFQELESRFRSHLRTRIERGHVTLLARWVEDPPREAPVQVDLARARALAAALTELRDALGLDGDIDLNLVARQPEVLRTPPPDAVAVAWDEVEPIVNGALDGVVESRGGEGAVLGDEVAARLDAITRHLDAVEARSPQRVVDERNRLREAVAALADGHAVSEDRLAQEIAILADRLDVTEEMVRLRAHIRVARDALTAAGAVGKQLGFLGQEMLREVNTIGSKANDASIAHSVIAMKGELEKIREQVENIE